MKKLGCLIPILLLLLLLLLISVTEIDADGEYRLGFGDILGISVWGYTELQIEPLAIRPDGKIAVPLAGEIQAAGLTPQELTSKLTAALGQYIIAPKVTVNVVKFRTTRVYVLGEVGKPGLYELEKGHHLLDALSAAGGFTRGSAKNKVYLVRNGQHDKYTLINLNKILRKGDLSQNYLLGEGDVVFLTRNTLDYVRDILPFITAMSQIDDIRDDD